MSAGTSNYGPHEVRDGSTVLRFNAAAVGSATSRWDGAPRWTELTVYRLSNGSYLVAKVGRSLVAHSSSCPAAQPWRMPTWAEAGAEDEARTRRVPCHVCQPAVGDQMDPQTLLETTRHSVLRAPGPSTLLAALMRGRTGEHTGMMAEIVHEVTRQVRANDPTFASWWNQSWAVPTTERS